MKTQLIIEALDLSEATIDAEARTVRQKIITAGKSKNGRYYSEAVLQRAASLFEGVKTYANHPGRAELKDRPERSVLDITGYLTDVRYEEGMLRGTRHFVGDAGEKVWRIVEQVVNHGAPASLIGASINAVGKGAKGKVNDEDVLIIESIDAVNSVDDVTTPAAGGGFERLLMSGDDLTLQLLTALDYQEWFESRPDYVKRLQHEMKQVRQDEALKAAHGVAEQLRTALTEAQAEIETLTGENTRLTGELDQSRRELALERALAKVTLPATWKTSLRSRLLEVSTDQWERIIEEELAKSRTTAKPRIAITGAGQQIAPSLVESKPTSRAPNWQEVLSSPEKFAAWQRSQVRSN